MRLTIEVELGNAAMRTGDDVSRLLWGLSGRVGVEGELDLGHGGRLMDINGNSVGTWRVESAGMQERLDIAVGWLAEKVAAGEVSSLDMQTLCDSDLAIAVDGSFHPPTVWLTDDALGPHVAGGVWIESGWVHGSAGDPDGGEYHAEKEVRTMDRRR